MSRSGRVKVRLWIGMSKLFIDGHLIKVGPTVADLKAACSLCGITFEDFT